MKAIFFVITFLSITQSFSQTTAEEFRKKGKELFDVNKISDAIEAYNKSIKLDSLNDETFLLRGAAKQKNKDIDGAIMDYSHCILINRNNINALFNRGSLYMKKEQFKDAEWDFERAIGELKEHVINAEGNFDKEIITALGIAYLNLGKACLAQEDYYCASDSFYEAGTHGVKGFEVKYAEGYSRYMYKDYSWAARSLSEALKYEQNIIPKAEILKMRAECYYATHEWLKASIDFDTLLLMQPADTSLLTKLGKCYFESKNYNSAMITFEELNRISPNVSTTLNYQGFSSYLGGKTIEGKDLIEKSIALDSSNSQAYMYLAYISFYEKSYEKGCQCTAKGTKIQNYDPDDYTLEVLKTALIACKKYKKYFR